MFTRNNIMRHNMCGGAMRDWLCFTAESANCTIRLDKVGSVDPISLETSTDGKTWTAYTWSGNTGTTITLASIGDKCYWRAGAVNTTISSSGSNYYQFKMTGKIAASGDIDYLLNKSGSVSSVPSYCYCQLFMRCSSLASPPSLPATSLSSGCYSFMFQDCYNLEGEIVLPAQNAYSTSYRYIFLRCAKVQRITLGLIQWGISTENWAKGVAVSGTFICPAVLDTSTRDDSHVPTGWVVKKRAYLNGGTIYNDAAHTTATTLIAGELYIAQDAGNALYYYNGSTLGTAHDAYYYGGTMYSDKEHTTAITPTADEYYFDQEGHSVYLYSEGEYTKVYPTS